MSWEDKALATSTNLDAAAAQVVETIRRVYGSGLSESDLDEVLASAIASGLLSAEMAGRVRGLASQPVDEVDSPLVMVGPAPSLPDAPELGPVPTLDETVLSAIQGRVTAALATIRAQYPAESVQTHVELVASNEVYESYQRGLQDGMREKGLKRYRRGVNPGACELCWWLYKDGYAYPMGQAMHKHKGCKCVPVPAS